MLFPEITDVFADIANILKAKKKTGLIKPVYYLDITRTDDKKNSSMPPEHTLYTIQNIIFMEYLMILYSCQLTLEMRYILS